MPGPQRAALCRLIAEGVRAGYLVIKPGPLATDDERLADVLFELHYRRPCSECGRAHYDAKHRRCSTCRKRTRRTA